MGMNRRKEFAACKKMTEPYLKIPGCVQEMLDICQIWQDGIFEIGHSQKKNRTDRMFDKVYEFWDINYVNLDQDEKRDILLSICKLFNTMNVDFKISVVNEPRNMTKLKKSILHDSKTSEYPELAEANNQLVLNALQKGQPHLSKRHYLTVTCRRGSYHQACVYFNILETAIEAVFREMESRITALDATGRLHMLYNFFHQDGKPDFTLQSLTENCRDWRNEIVPYTCNHKESRLEFGEEYMQILFVPSLPNGINESKLVSQLTNVSFYSSVTIDCACIPRDVLKAYLEAANINNEVAINKEVETNVKNNNFGSGPSYKKKKTKSEIEEYMEQIEDNDENGFFMQMLVAVRGNSCEELKENVETIRILGASMSIKFIPDYNQQLQALNTVLPMGARRVDHMRTILTSSLAAFQPYHAKDIVHESGYLYGVNKLTGNIIMLDRKKLKNGNGIIIGHTGSGKSMILKLTEIGQTLLCTNDDIFMLDPQNEMEDVAALYGGQYFDLTSRTGVYLNPFEVPEDILYSDNVKRQQRFIGKKADFGIAFVYSCLQGRNPTGIHKTIIVRCIKKMYEYTFLQKRPVSPVLDDFVNILKEQKEPEARELYVSLETYVYGTFDMFSKQSNLNINARFVAYGMKNVPDSMWETCMLTIMHLLSMRMEYNVMQQKATRFIVDEGQYICRNKSSAEELEKAFITFRKFGGINTLCLQNITAAFANPKIENIVSNCDFKLILDQGGSDRNALRSIMELSSKEFMELATSEVGQCLISFGGQILLCNAKISKENALYKAYNTNFHEKAEQMQGA